MKKTIIPVLLSLCFFMSCGACQKVENKNITTGTAIIQNITLTLNKACYSPGETITFTSDKALSGAIHVRYRYLSQIIEDKEITGKTWTWIAPSTDFKGYLAEVYLKNKYTEKIIGSIGIDVSSDWKRFPRYGFLSSFGHMSSDEMKNIISNLCRYHINGLQFYDWHCDHHKPLAGTVENPASSWLNIASRMTYRSTIDGYIAEAKKQNMRSMFYNLCYGALKNAADDGVKEEWYIFSDATHTNKYTLSLSAPFKSSIYLTNPGNEEWLNYMVKRVKEVYDVYGFDGFHIDQVGINGVYDSQGQIVNLPEGFGKFINKMHEAFPDKYNVFNAVAGFGQSNIAASNVDFLYNEVWEKEAYFSDLKTIIDNNTIYSKGKLNTIFAAYMNYNLAENKGTFNTPGVLMTDAVMFAIGGAHLELGEHMLGKEYFPNSNLSMSPLLKQSLISYYDFLVAYQNILRDGGSFNDAQTTCTNTSSTIVQWPPQAGKVISLGKKLSDKQVIHLFNFKNATHLSWRDMDGTQAEPLLVKSMPLKIMTAQTPKKIWAATPDNEGRIYQELDFTSEQGFVSLTLPVLKYWTMIVLEY